jgi:hypothetical protein
MGAAKARIAVKHQGLSKPLEDLILTLVRRITWPRDGGVESVSVFQYTG